MSGPRTELVWLALCWPRDVQPEQLTAAFRLLAALSDGPLVLQATGTTTGVEHHLALRRSRMKPVMNQLRAALPGLAIDVIDHPPIERRLHRAVRLSLSSRRRRLRSDHLEQVSVAVLTALASADRREALVLQWVLGPRLTPRIVPNRLPGQHADTWGKALLAAPWSAPAPPDADARSALRAKQGEPGWRAIGRVAVRATSLPRQRQLLGAVVGALRTVQAPGVSFIVRSERTKRVSESRSPWHWPLVLNIAELAACSAWPVGPTSELPVRRVGSRLLAPSRRIPARGRIIGTATWPGATRRLALSPADSLQHVHVLGPTGVGKSTLLLNLIVQDLAAGRGVVVIEPKGDLIADVLPRVPERRLADVVLLDPTDESRPVGLNPLDAAGRSPELVADQLLNVFHGLYAAYWGPRTQDILYASLLTLARLPGMTLVALPLLLTDPAFRRHIVGRLNDPVALEPFWAGFEAWSEAERTTAIAPVLNKLRPFILRPQLRRVIGQARPRFDLRQVFSQRKVLLVNLSKGQLGPESAALLGSLVVAQLWQATLERSRISAERRHPVMVFVDEFQDYLHLPTDLSDTLTAARGLGVGLHLAHQHLHQLPAPMRSAVLANARSRVCFQLPAEDARSLAGTTNALEADDFQNLGRFEVYAALLAEGSGQPWCSARTVAPCPPVLQPAMVRAASRKRYGRAGAGIDGELQVLVGGDRRQVSSDDLRPKRRPSGGMS